MAKGDYRTEFADLRNSNCNAMEVAGAGGELNMQTPAEKFLMDTIKRSLNQHCGLRSDAAMLIFKFAREKTRKDSLSGSIMDYLDYAVEQGAMDTIIDPEEDSLWEIFRKLELDDESLKFKEEAKTFKFKGIEKVIYA